MLRPSPFVFLFALTAAGACENASPSELACDAFVDTLVEKLADDCQLASPSEARDIVRESFRAVGIGSCEDVDDIRDEDELYEECLPAVEALDCDEVTTAQPPSCSGQLIVYRTE